MKKIEENLFCNWTKKDYQWMKIEMKNLMDKNTLDEGWNEI